MQSYSKASLRNKLRLLSALFQKAVLYHSLHTFQKRLRLLQLTCIILLISFRKVQAAAAAAIRNIVSRNKEHQIQISPISSDADHAAGSWLSMIELGEHVRVGV